MNIQDMRQNYWTMKYRSRWPTFVMMSIVVSYKTSIPSFTLIHEIVFKIIGKTAGAWKYDHNDLDLITLNVDVINMSDAHPSLSSCLYKQTAAYYFFEAHPDSLTRQNIRQNHWSMKIRSQWPWSYYTECWCNKHVWCPSFFNKRLFV